MITSELDRLGRLVAPSPARPTSSCSIDLDATIGPVVVSHQARGRHISWSPSGYRVRANPDAVAEMINVLLDNAAKHARSDAEVTVVPNGDHVEVVVHDDGPGVDRSLLNRLFEWGARGARSGGQGIGLHVARELALQQGGTLRLLEDRSGGATFVLGLPGDPAGRGGTSSPVEDLSLHDEVPRRWGTADRAVPRSRRLPTWAPLGSLRGPARDAARATDAGQVGEGDP